MKHLALAALLLTPLPAASATLSQAVDAAVAREPGLAAQRAQVEEARAALSASRLSRLPQLRARSEFTRGDDPVYAFSTLLRRRDFTAQDFAVSALNNPGYMSNFESALELGVPLFTGFSLTEQERVRSLALERAQAGLDAAAQGARQQAAEAFLNVLLARQSLSSLDEAVAAAQEDAAGAERLQSKGLVLGSDYQGALAILAGLRMRRAQAARALEGARQTLAVLAGQDVDAEGSLSTATYAVPPVAQLLAGAQRRLPRLKDARLSQSMAAAMRRRETLSLLPQVEAFGALATDSQDLSGGASNRMFGVRASLPLGDPTYWSRRRAADARWRASRDFAAREREAVEIDVRQAYAAYQAAVDSLPAARDALERAQQSLRLFHPLYREGRQSILDVMRAQQGQVEARQAYLQTLFAVHAGYARLEASAGELDPAAVARLQAALSEARP